MALFRFMTNPLNGDFAKSRMAIREPREHDDTPVLRIKTGAAAQLITREYGIPCSSAQVNAWINQGRLPAIVGPGGTRWVLPDDVLACYTPAVTES